MRFTHPAREWLSRNGPTHYFVYGYAAALKETWKDAAQAAVRVNTYKYFGAKNTIAEQFEFSSRIIQPRPVDVLPRKSSDRGPSGQKRLKVHKASSADVSTRSNVNVAWDIALPQQPTDLGKMGTAWLCRTGLYHRNWLVVSNNRNEAPEVAPTDRACFIAGGSSMKLGLSPFPFTSHAFFRPANFEQVWTWDCQPNRGGPTPTVSPGAGTKSGISCLVEVTYPKKPRLGSAAERAQPQSVIR